jgi:hypothetical protein
MATDLHCKVRMVNGRVSGIFATIDIPAGAHVLNDSAACSFSTEGNSLINSLESILAVPENQF